MVALRKKDGLLFLLVLNQQLDLVLICELLI